MKICFYGYTLATAATGTAAYIYTIANAIAKKGHDITIVSKGEIDRNLIDSKIKFVSILSEGRQSKFLIFLFFLKSIYYFLFNRNYDLIHITSGYHDFAPMGYLIKLISGVPIVYSVLTDTNNVFWYKKLSLLLCVNESTVSRIGKKAVFFPTPIEHKERINEVSLKDEKLIYIGAMGTTSYRKGLGVLADSIEYILKENSDVHFKLAIDFVQNGVKDQVWQEAELTRIKKVLSEKQIKDHVTIFGKVDISGFLSSLDILVYPIQSTAGMNDIPPTLLEGMEHSLCVIISDIGNISKIVNNGVNAILLKKSEYSEPKGLAENILKVLSNKDLIMNIKRNANPSIGKYSIDNRLDYITDLYSKLIQ